MVRRLLSVCCVLLLLVTTSSAAVMITAMQSGNDVVFSGSGSLVFGSLELVGFGGGNGFVRPTAPEGVLIGSAEGLIQNLYTGEITKPGDFGTGEETAADEGDGHLGDLFGIDGSLVSVPGNYIPGNLLSGTMTLTDHSFETLLLEPGVYTWSWGEGRVDGDSITLRVVVPEASTFASGLSAVVTGGAYLARRRKTACALALDA